MNDMVDVTVNGEPRAVARGATLLELLESLALDPRAVAVEHNRAIVRRPRLAAVTAAPGDAIELAHFDGGGLARPRPWRRSRPLRSPSGERRLHPLRCGR